MMLKRSKDGEPFTWNPNFLKFRSEAVTGGSL